MKCNYIGIIADDSPDVLIGIFGILKSGNAFVPINPVFPNHRIHFIVNDCGIKILLTDNANREKARQIAEENPSIRHILTLEDFTAPDLHVYNRDHDEEEKNGYCYVIYTSGSTGRPKGVPITHGNLVPLFSWFGDYFRLGTHTRILRNLSYTFDFGVFEILTTLLYGGCAHGADKVFVGDFSRYASFINQHQVNTLHTTPVFFSNISDSGEKMPSLDLLHLGGERLTGKTVRQAAAVISPRARIYNGYGPTEATINCAVFALSVGEAGVIGETDNIPIGSASAFNELSILDKHGNPQPVGVPGELCVSGPGLAHGYLNRPELTQGFFNKTYTVFYKTGDLCRWLPTGDIQFLGRIDHQVKVRGFRIELGEIENALRNHPIIKEAVVVAKQHQAGSNYLCAYFVADTEIILSQLREFLLNELPDYMVPAYFIPLETIPLTPNGKTDLRALPEPDHTAIDSGVEFVAPQTRTQHELVLIWRQLLQREKIGIHDDFFEMGGDSILVNRCIAHIREDLRVEIPLRTFFERPYIKALAEEIENRDRRVSSITPAPREGEIPLSFAQERLWFLQELDSENTAYFVPRVIRMKGDLDITLVERTFTEIVRRHEILRTVFSTVDGTPVQKIQPPFPFKIPVFDWQGVEAEEQTKNINEFLTREGVRPFNFETGPLLRVTILKLNAKENLLVLTEHHLVHDGWTQGVLLREFIAIFTAYSEGRDHRLPGLPIQYADYTVWQRNLLRGDVLEHHLSYWEERLSGLAPVLDLPTDRPRPPVISGEGGLNIFRLSSSFTRRLKDFSRKHGVTYYMTLLTVFKVLLYRYTGVEDLCVGTGIANRGYKEMEGMLGMVINTLPLRTRVRGDIAFDQCLRRVKETCLEAYQHEDTPFGKIVERINPPRSLSYSPIFQVIFSFMDTPTEELRLPGLDLELLDSHNRSSKFDINVVVVPPPENNEDGETLVEWEYNTDIFDDSTAARMVDHYNRLLERAVHSPGESLFDLPMLSDAELDHVLNTLNQTAADYPRDKTIHRLFEEQVARTPDAAVLNWSYKTHTSYLTYSELNNRADRLADLLRTKGVDSGTIVGLLLERSVEMMIGILGILKAGGAYLPIDPGYPDERKHFMLKDSNVKILLSDMSEISEGCLRRLSEGQGEAPPGPPTKLAYVMYTSGSTGGPKGVMVTHRNVVRLVKNTGFVPLNEKTRILQTGAPVFDATTFEIWGSLLNGGLLVLTDKETILDANRLSRALKDHEINTLWLSSPLFNQLVGQDTGIFAPLSYLLVGGDVLSPPHINRVRERFPGLNVINGYGPTENTTFSTTYRIDKTFEQNIPIGRPISNSRAYILDHGRGPVPVGVFGELYVGGDGVARGYLNNPVLTAERFCRSHKNDILYKTGDLARWLPNGTIDFKGRIDQQVKIRGFRIELEEIENRLMDHENIKEAVVVARRDSGDKYLCAYVVPGEKKDEGPPDLKQFLSRTLPDYMLPSFFVTLDEIPLTPNGKVDRQALPEPGIDMSSTGEAYRAPRDDVEERLAVIWADVLGIEKENIGIDSEFFELGGHSLNATVVVSRVHKAFNVKVPVVELFVKDTIRELAHSIRGAKKDIFTAVEPVEKMEYYPLSPAQKRLYLLHQMDEKSTGYNVPVMLILEGDVDKERMESVFKQLIERHESLRTSFMVVNETPVQKVHEAVDFTLENCSHVSCFIRSFDLSRAPLFRVELARRREREYVLMLDMHHIITDGTSMGLFVKEFTSLYAGETLPALPLQYKDYSRWQNLRLREEIIHKQASYWKETFSGDIPLLELPADFPRPTVQCFDGARTGFELTEEETQSLKEFASREGLTLYTVLLAIFYVFLSKLSGSEEIVVGTAAAGRRHTDLEPIIGMFVNTLALKNRPRGQYSFKEFLGIVNKQTLQAFENQDYPFEELVENISLNRDSGRNPLFDVMFVLQNVDIPEVRLPGLKLEPMPVETGTSKFDLMLQAMEKGEKLLLTYEYGTALFKAETIERFKGFFRRIVSVVMGSPSVKLSEIEIVSPEEKRQILEDFNNTTRDYPSDKTIHQLFEEQVLRTPDAVALHMSYRTHMTYIELNERSGRLAGLLQTKGVGPDTIAGLMLERSFEMVIGILGVLKTGGAYLPIDPDYPEERKQYMLTDSSAVLLLTDRDIKGCREQACLFHDPADSADSADRPDPTDSGTLAYIMYTSGSTGGPKGVMVTHRNVVRLVKNTEFVPLSRETRVLQTGAPVFDATTFEIWGSLLNGGLLVLTDRETILDANRLGRALKDHEINTLWLSSPLFNQLVGQDTGIFAPLSYLLVGGDVLSPSHINRVRERFPRLNVINGYGPTENTTFSTTYLIEKTFEQNIPIGGPITNSTAYILDRNGGPLPVGVFGELVVGGDGVARGYLNTPELTNQKFLGVQNPFYKKGSGRRRQKFYKTGDLARWLPDGTIEFRGRIDQQVKIRGFRIELEEIENRLLSHISVKEAVVTAREDSPGNKYLCAYIVPHPSAAVDMPELKQYLSGGLPDYMVPSFFLFLDKIPLNSNGKVDRNALPEPGCASRERQMVVPRNAVEEKLANIWADVLDIPGGETEAGAEAGIVGIDDNFFEMGGHSLKAMLLLSKIHESFNVRIPMATLFKFPTIRGLSEYIGDAEQEAHASIDPVEKMEYYPLSPAQRRMYLLHQMDENGTGYNVPVMLNLEGDVDKDRMENVFKQLIERHESLRTSFAVVNETPVQKIHQTVDFTLRTLTSCFVRPFDLSRAPLLRVELIKRQDCDHILMLDMHHIITDGTSMAIFVREFTSLYAGDTLPSLPLQYKDYSRWQNLRLREEIIEKQASYWKDRFGGDIPVLELPTDFSRPAIQRFDGARSGFELTREETRYLKEFALVEGLTLYTVLLAIFYVFLSKLSHSEEIVVGTAAAGRSHADIEPVIGMFVNTLVLKNRPRGHLSFKEFLDNVNKQTLKDFENQDYPFEELVENVSANMDTGRNPLFDVMFVLQNVDIPEVEIPGLKLKPLPVETGTSKFDLMLQAMETGEKLLLTYEYGTALFKAETIERFKDFFRRIVSAVMERPSIKLSEIEIVSPDEKRQILEEFNNTTRDYPSDRTIPELFDEQVRRTPDAVALHMSYRTHMTYTELNERSGGLASLLQTKGVGPDTIVGLMLERSVEMVIGILGISKAGGAYLPIDPDYPEERKQYMLTDSSAALLLTARDIKGCREQACLFHDPADRPDPTDSGTLAYIMYTSGSTGGPKGVMVTHRNVVRLVKNTEFVPLNEETRILQTGAPVFDATTFEIWGSLLNGGRLVLTEKTVILDAQKMGDALMDCRINTLWLSAPLFNRLLQQNIEIFAPLRYLLVGGDVLSPPHINRVRERFPGLSVINGYGPTENTTFSTTFPVDEPFEQNIPIGRPITNSTVYILDRYRRPVPVGVFGELVVGGDGVARGYLNNPELTAERFSRGAAPSLPTPYPLPPILTPSYRTGDLARWLPGGTIEFKGRIDQQVKIRGFRVELEEIENRLRCHKSIKEVVVTVRGKDEDKYICAYFTLRSNAAETTGPEKFRDYLSGVLPDYMVPAHFVELESLPLNPNGKIDRGALPEPGIGSHVNYSPPSNPVETTMTRIWAEVLGIEESSISIDANFFELGGHSLKATGMTAKINKELNAVIPLAKVFETPTIRELAKLITPAVNAGFSIEPAEEKEFYPLSPMQNRFFILNQLQALKTAYNIPSVLEIEGKLDRKRIEDAFQQLVCRQESLRTSFMLIEKEPVQKIHKDASLKIAYNDLSKDPVDIDALVRDFVLPFDLSTAPLLRVQLIKVEEEKHILMVDIHHIISDGTSMGILIKDLVMLYDMNALPPLPLQYKDFSQWLHGVEGKEAVARQETYWLDQFQGPLPVLNMYTDYPRPPAQSFKGETINFSIGEAVSLKIKRLVVENDTTLYMVLLAALNILLSAYSGQEDIVVGTPIAGRENADLENIVALFINALPIRNYPCKDKTFRQFLMEVKKNTINAYENQGYPFETLVEKLGVKKDLSRNPLFDVELVVLNMENPALEAEGLRFTQIKFELGVSQVDLAFYVSEYDEDIRLNLMYSTDLFNRETMNDFIDFFREILAAATNNMEIKLEDFKMKHDFVSAETAVIVDETSDFGF